MNSEIIFSKHALYQMQERGLSAIEIATAISKPDKLISQSPQKCQAVKLMKQNGKTYLLVVIYRKINSFKKVITAFRTSKINKYLQR